MDIHYRTTTNVDVMRPEYIYALCPECHVAARSKVAADPTRWSALRPLLSRTVACCPQCGRTIVLAQATLVSHHAAAGNTHPH